MSMVLWCAAFLASATPETSPEVMTLLAPTEGGLTIEEVVRRAVETSPQAKQSLFDYRKAASDSNSAYLLYVPRVDVSAGYTRQKKIVLPFPDGMGNPTTETPVNNYSVMANLSIAASDYFLRIVQGYDAAKTGEEVARHQLSAAQDDVAIRAIESFLNTVRARAGALVANQSVDVLTEQLQDVRQLADAGLSTEGDVLQLRAQVASAKVGKARADGALRIAETAMRRTLHDDDLDLRHADDLLAEVAVVVPEPGEAVALAFDQRSEVRALRRLAHAQGELAKIERAGLFPRVTIDGNVTHAKPNQQAFFDFQNFNTTWQIGINLRWSPNDAVRAWSNWSKAKDDTDAVKNNIVGLTDAITIEVTSALDAIRTGRESIVAAKEGLEAASGAFEDRQNLLAAGSGTTRELLLAEQDLRNARLQLINAHLDLRLASAQFDRALGRLRKGDDQ